ncbi:MULTISPECIES: cytochrome-c oxidase, cbb3-type subunit III [unclassified Meridianimarinicoccus]|uniref:cytochrome-c oxidase, cbb3-type subunit III n=1 Tax=unclassified Meridianimarinicoccus TaxID=2923344 RepID=UPI001867CD03|nr:cytochrome-c oxidase, cbb3-type subunit III [Fluviibacterium sp. MJW13]
MSNKPDEQDGVPTTGHSWDGIEEFDNPMPRWWLWCFYATIVWGIGYSIAYPAWPMINKATAGILGFSTRGDLAADMEAAEAAHGDLNAALASIDLTEVANNASLDQFAVSKGAAVYRTWCSQCHGSGAAGAIGFPNLLDDAWLWGGDIEAIQTTVMHGIRNEEDPDARYSEMPRFGADDLLESEQIDQVVNYVMSLSGDPVDAEAAAAGEEVYMDNCAACHAEDGTGDRDQGAPNLTDAVWLYGGDYDAVMESVENARFGVMPPWQGRLTQAEINAVSVYVHQLGGGE